MTDVAGLIPIEYFVLQQSDGHALLWELAAVWTNSEDQTERIGAVPLLADALVSLVRHGLVEVHSFATWPMNWNEACAVPADEAARMARVPENWLWRDDLTSLIVVSLTDAGVPWL